MEYGILTQCLNSRSFSIAMNLSNGFIPLSLSLRCFSIFTKSREILLWQYLQFYDVTMLYCIMSQIRQ